MLACFPGEFIAFEEKSISSLPINMRKGSVTIMQRRCDAAASSEAADEEAGAWAERSCLSVLFNHPGDSENTEAPSECLSVSLQ